MPPSTALTTGKYGDFVLCIPSLRGASSMQKGMSETGCTLACLSLLERQLVWRQEVPGSCTTSWLHVLASCSYTIVPCCYSCNMTPFFAALL